MKQAGIFLKRVLLVGPPISDTFTCAACGSLNNLPPAHLPMGIAPILATLLPDATGRTLEAVATLLASLVGSKVECNAFIGCRGVLAVLDTSPTLTPNPEP